MKQKTADKMLEQCFLREFKATCKTCSESELMGSRDGAVVRALASRHCGLGSIPGVGVICALSLLLVLILAPGGFSPGTLVFPFPQKPTLLNSKFNLESVPN